MFFLCYQLSQHKWEYVFFEWISSAQALLFTFLIKMALYSNNLRLTYDFTNFLGENFHSENCS